MDSTKQTDVPEPRWKAISRHAMVLARTIGLRRVWRSKLLRISYLVSILTLFALEHFDEIAEGIWGSAATDSKYLQPALFYQAVTKAGYRHPRAHYVRLVTFDPLKEPQWLQGSECLSRSFEAKLISAISKAHPALIVLDEYFPEDDCVEQDPKTGEFIEDKKTKELKSAIAHLTQSGVPIVLAEYSLNDDEQVEFMQKGKLRKGTRLKPWEILLQPRIQFDGEDKTPPSITYGAAELDADSRRIPIRWNEYDSQADMDAGKGPFELLGLAAQAASVYDSSMSFQHQLERLDTAKEDPFTSFLAETEFIQFESLDVICGRSETSPKTDWQNCSPSSFAMKDLSGHIVLVGDASEDDKHKSVLGDVHGLVLQANYIESLLDDRVLFPVPWAIELTSSLILFFLIQMTFDRLSVHPIRATLLAFFWVTFSCLLCYLIVLLFGFYMYIWVPGLLAILGEYLSIRSEGKPKRQRVRVISRRRKPAPEPKV